MIEEKRRLFESEICRRLGESASFSLLATAKQLEKQGKEILHLEIGEPDFAPPPVAKNALMKSLKAGETHYTTPQGIPELRKAIAEYELSFRKIEVDPDRIVITPGAKPLILLTLLATINPGEKVLYPDPGYLSYKSLIMFAGGTAVPYRLRREDHFAIDFDDLISKIDGKTAVIIINSPSNPTGVILKPEEIRRVLEIAREYDLIVISDEVYSRIIYDSKPHVSVFEFIEPDDRVILIDAFSKTYAMTGFRLGYGILPEELVRPVVKLIQNSFSCTPPFIQRAGIAAIKEGQEYVERMVNEFERRRNRIFELMSRVEGLEVYKPEGAFYFFPRLKRGISSREFAQYVLEKYGVALLPGNAFGENGEGHLRISFANSLDVLEKAVERIGKAIKDLS